MTDGTTPLGFALAMRAQGLENRAQDAGLMAPPNPYESGLAVDAIHRTRERARRDDERQAARLASPGPDNREERPPRYGIFIGDMMLYDGGSNPGPGTWLVGPGK